MQSEKYVELNTSLVSWKSVYRRTITIIGDSLSLTHNLQVISYYLRCWASIYRRRVNTYESRGIRILFCDTSYISDSFPVYKYNFRYDVGLARHAT